MATHPRHKSSESHTHFSETIVGELDTNTLRVYNNSVRVYEEGKLRER